MPAEEMYRLAPHIHTDGSHDYCPTVRDYAVYLEQLAQRGFFFDALAITDHAVEDDDVSRSFDQCEAMRRACSGVLGLQAPKVFYGAEMMTPAGDTLLLSEERPSDRLSPSLPPRELHEAASSIGALTAACHPTQRIRSPHARMNPVRGTQAMLDYIRTQCTSDFDLVETVNAFHHDSRMQFLICLGLLSPRHEPILQEALSAASPWGYAAMGSSDAHMVHHIDRAWTEYPQNNLGPWEALKRAVRERATEPVVRRSSGLTRLTDSFMTTKAGLRHLVSTRGGAMLNHALRALGVR